MRTARFIVQLLMVAALLGGTTPGPIEWPQARLMQKGIAYMSWERGEYSSSASDLALAKLAATGASHVSIGLTVYQDTLTSTTIQSGDSTPSDEDLGHAIDTAHTLGLRVMLKPHLDLAHDGQWRGEIGKGFQPTQWEAWFASYRTTMVHYARLAQAYGVEQFCAGTELRATSHREEEWRETIRQVRAVYGGAVTYAAIYDTEAERIAWWDAVDYIGIDAYFTVSNQDSPTLNDLMAGWKPHVEMMRRLAHAWHKPVLLTEIGYRSVKGASQEPWNWQSIGVIDLHEQALAYEAAFRSLAAEPWFVGVFWWMWSANPNGGGEGDDSYAPLDKPAEDVLRRWYGAPPRATMALALVSDRIATRDFPHRACAVECKA